MKLLLSDKRKLIINEKDLKDDLNTDVGLIKKTDLTLSKPGAKIKTHLGAEFTVLDPSFNDLFESLQRGPQIITLKDAGLISAYTGISSGSRVIDAGLGSGALACYLANLVKPNGLVYAYELRDDFIKIARENIDMFGLNKFVNIRNKDIYSGIDERDVDVITLDLPEPWKVIKSAEKALKTGGYLVSYLPTITQVGLLSDELKNSVIRQLKVIELIERPWKVQGKVMRPENLILGHTGFILIARKI